MLKISLTRFAATSIIRNACTGSVKSAKKWHSVCKLCRQHEHSTTVWSEWVTESEEYEKRGEIKSAKKTVKRLQCGTVKELQDAFERENCVKSWLLTYLTYVTSFVNTENWPWRHWLRRRQSSTLIYPRIGIVNMPVKYKLVISVVVNGRRQFTLAFSTVIKATRLLQLYRIHCSMGHGANAIWAHLEPVLSDIKKSRPLITTIKATVSYSAHAYLKWDSAMEPGTFLKPAIAKGLRTQWEEQSKGRQTRLWQMVWISQMPTRYLKH